MFQIICYDLLFPEPQLPFSFTIWAPFPHLLNKSVPPTRAVLLPLQTAALAGWSRRGSRAITQGFQALARTPSSSSPGGSLLLGTGSVTVWRGLKSSPYCAHSKVPAAGPGLSVPMPGPSTSRLPPPPRSPSARGLQPAVLGALGQAPVPRRPQFASVM